ncbi:carbohydrate esterase family 16 protein [Peniophora sp. CONT]|nr:carbohydrate esterase family 16 protein [Peniophora sp. CONT]
MIVFGDSYTTNGFNISAGIDSPVPGFTSSNGPNWVDFMQNTYNVTDTKVFNLAYGGATIDSALVEPYLPTVLSVVNQVSQFQEFLASKPAGAEWSSNDTLFAVWIGINDVGNSYAWTNVTQHGFQQTLMNRLFGQIELLYDAGARNFLFLTVPPTNRAPLLIEAGQSAVKKITSSLAGYNSALKSSAAAFEKKHAKGIGSVTIFDTNPVFNTLLDNADAFGFVNATGFCDAYENGTPTPDTQDAGCAPVANYFWLNTLHPLFTVHNMLAHALSTVLSS